MKTVPTVLSVLAMLALAVVPAGAQSSFSVSYNSGGTWNTVYAQGFSTSLGATPAPAVNNGATVDLTQFQFFKSGNADSASSIQLAIFNTLYPNLTGLTTGSASFVGLSANTIASTASLSTGAPITFTFNNLPLIYGNNYAAYFVNVSGVNLTPVLVSALTANYVNTGVDTGSGVFHPTPNYGTDTQFQYATGNSISGGFLSAFSYAGDANFNASFITVPEPSSCSLLGLAALVMIRRVVRQKVR